MTSRVRCSCGRIYDPVKHQTCPDCGAESAVESIVVAEKTKPPLPPEIPKPAPPNGEKRPSLDYQQLLRSLPWPVYAAAAAFVVIVLMIALHRRSLAGNSRVAGETRKQLPPAADVAPSPGRTQSPGTEIPSGGGTAPPAIPSPAMFPPGGMPALATGNLSDLIAKAGPNGTVRLAPGLYQGGAVVTQPVRIIGENASQVFIQSDTRDALSVRSKGVVLQNVQIFFNGNGEVPAVSVSDNAELETDGVKITSNSGYGLMVSANASVKASASTFSVMNGTAVQVNRQSQANFTKCSFSDAQIGMNIVNGSNVELHACSFERNGGRTGRGSIMTVSGDKTKLTADDCRFASNPGGAPVSEGGTLIISNSQFKENGISPVQGNSVAGLIQVRTGGSAKLSEDVFETNSQGLVATNGGTLDVHKCRFDGTGLQTRGELIASCMAICGNGQGTSLSVSHSTINGSASYLVAAIWSARLNIEETEVSGARTVGLLVGDRNGLPAVAEVKHCKFARNTTGIGVCAGSSATITDSESRENSEGVIALDRGTRVVLTKAMLIGNREHGLCVYGGADGQAMESQIENNGRGAQSGMQHKSSVKGGSLTLQNCRVAGNQIFGVGAYAKNQLTLSGVTFEGNGKTNIYRENGAIVRADGAADSGQAQATNNEDAEPGESPGDNQGTSKRSRRSRRQGADDDARRIIRRFFPRP